VIIYINAMSRIHPPLPPTVARALRKLGGDIRDARRRRRLPMETVAERALITRVTLGKVERGDPAVSLGIYATVLYVLGLVDRLALVADPGQDSVGLALEGERLPQRVRLPSRRRSAE
jgi:transcriptional regulator with XRE-family HTH domain